MAIWYSPCYTSLDPTYKRCSLLMTYFTQPDTFHFQSHSDKLYYFNFSYSGVVIHYVYISLFNHLFLDTVVSDLEYCEVCCNEYWSKIFFWIEFLVPWSKCQEAKLLGHMEAEFLVVVFERCPYCFSKRLTQPTFPPTEYKCSSFPTSMPGNSCGQKWFSLFVFFSF